MLSWLKHRRFLFLPQRFSSAVLVDELLSVRHRTLRQTRSGAGDAHASRQGLPLFRTLNESLHRCPQAQVRTFPFVMGDGGDGVWWIKMGCQKCRVQVTLERPNPAGTVMPAL